MPRFVFLLGCGLTAVTLAFTATDQLLTPTPAMTLENARLIRPGMALRQVKRILGPVQEKIAVFGSGGLTDWAGLEVHLRGLGKAAPGQGVSMLVFVEGGWLLLGIGPDCRVSDVALG